MKVELEDLAFRYLYPEAYNELVQRMAKKEEEREQYTEEVKGIIQREIEKFGLKGEVEGRAKHLFSIYAKMEAQHIDFDEVYDLIAFRIILDSDKENECYEALSVVHALWKPVPGRFKDYIAMPKANTIALCTRQSSAPMASGWRSRSAPGDARVGRRGHSRPLALQGRDDIHKRRR